MDEVNKSQKDEITDVDKYREKRTQVDEQEVPIDVDDPFSLVTTRSMSAQLRTVLNDPLDDETYDLKRKIFEHKENVYDFFGKNFFSNLF